MGMQKHGVPGLEQLVEFGLPRERLKEADLFEELLEGREFGCKVQRRRKQHSRQGDYWASLQRCGKADPFEGTSRKFDLAESGRSKRNRLENKQGPKKDILSQIKVFLVWDLIQQLVMRYLRIQGKTMSR